MSQKKSSHAPAFLIGLLFLFVAAFLLWNFFYAPSGMSKPTSFESINGIASVRLEGGSNFMENSGVDILLEGEAIRAREGSIRLSFFEGTRVTLDAESELSLTRVRKREDDGSEEIILHLHSGRLWASVPKKINPNSHILLENSLFSAEIRGGEVSFSEESVAVASGRARLFAKNAIVEEIEVGQEIFLSKQDIETFQATGVVPEKKPLAVEFLESEWFSVNNSQNNSLASPLPASSSPIDTSSNSEVSDKFENEEALGIPEGPNPPPLRILKPGKNGETIRINEDSLTLSGMVPENTEKVIVNDYTLSKFKPGDTEFSYNAAIQWGSLKDGRNEYNVVAIGQDGTRYEASLIVLRGTETDEESVSLEEKNIADDTTSQENDETKTSSVNTDLVIDAPKEGAELDDETIFISGKAPKSAAKIVVDDYTLSQFVAGSGTWVYRMSERFGNRKIGEQTIKIVAFDASGNEIARSKITFTALPPKQAISPPPITPLQKTAEDQKNWGAEIREGTLPPVPSDDNAPTI